MSKKRSDGEGSIHQVHAKGCEKPVDHRGVAKCKCKWRGVLVTGYRQGKKPGTLLPVRKTVTRSTRSAAAAGLRELQEKHSANTLPTGKVPTLEQWLNHCHAVVLPRQKRPPRESTMIAYRRIFDQYLIPTMGHLRLDRITADDIEGVWLLLAEQGNPTLPNPRPLSPSTIHQSHTILSRMLRLAMQKRKLTANPAGPDSMDAPAKSSAEVEPLTSEQWRKVLDTARGRVNAARWTVALAIGLRQGEALGLRWSDVDLDDGLLRVRQIVYRLPGRGIVFGEPKTERSKRDIALPDQLVAELRAHRREQNEARLAAGDAWHDLDLVFATPFGTPIDSSRDRKAWVSLLADAGVPFLKLHGARHTAATMMLLRGIDPRVVMDIMGWSQISTAANYRHAVDEAKRAAAKQIGAAIWA